MKRNTSAAFTQRALSRLTARSLAAGPSAVLGCNVKLLTCSVALPVVMPCTQAKHCPRLICLLISTRTPSKS